MPKLDELVVEIHGNTVDLDRRLKDLEGKLKKTGASATEVGGRVSTAFTQALDPVRFLQAGLVGLGGAAVLSSIGSLTTKAEEFNQKLRDISTLSDMSAKDIQRMGAQIQLVALDTQTRSIDLAAAQYNILSAGITDAAESMEVLQKAAELAKVGISDPLQAVNIMTSAINSFGITAEQAADTIFTTVQAGKTTVADLAMSFGNVAAIAAATGVSFNELQAATAALTLTGQTASIAQNNIKAAISNILTPTADAVEEIKRLNKNAQGITIEFSAASLKAKGLTVFLDELRKVTGGNADSLKRLFGSVEAYNAVLGLTTTQSEAYHSNLLRMDNAQGLVTKTMDKQKNTVKQAQVTWEELGRNAGDALNNIMSPALLGLNDVLKDFIVLTNEAATNTQKLNSQASIFQRLQSGLRTLTFPGGMGAGLALQFGLASFGPELVQKKEPKAPQKTGKTAAQLKAEAAAKALLEQGLGSPPPKDTGGSKGSKKKSQAEIDLDWVKSILPQTEKVEISIARLNDVIRRGTVPAKYYNEAMKELLDDKWTSAQDAFKKLHPELEQFMLSADHLKEFSDRTIWDPFTKNIKELGEVANNLDYKNLAIFRGLLESTWSEGERNADVLGKFFAIYQSGAITIEQYTDAVNKFADANLRASESAQTTTTAMEDAMGRLGDVVNGWSQGVEDTFINAFKTGEVSFKEMIGSMLESLARFVLQVTVLEPIFGRLADLLHGGNGSTSKKGVSIFGLVKGVFSLFGKGGATTNLGNGPVPLPGRAAGGPVRSGVPYIVGEKQPELFIPSVSGTIMPSLNGTGGGMAFHQTINISPGVAGQVRAEIAAAMPQIKRDTTRGVMEGIQKGGSLARAVGRKA